MSNARGLIKNKWLMVLIIVCCGLFLSGQASADTVDPSDNGANLSVLEPVSPVLVIGGQEISNGMGFLDNFYYLTVGQIPTSAAGPYNIPSTLGGSEAWQRGMIYSSLEDHGTPTYYYRVTEGILLNKLAQALGVDTTKNISVEAKATDGYSSVLSDAFSVTTDRYYYPADGSAGSLRMPILDFSINTKLSSLTYPDSELAEPVMSSSTLGVLPSLVYGQTVYDEHNHCKIVKNVNRLRLGGDQSAFIAYNSENEIEKSITLSDIVNLGVYETDYAYLSQNANITHHLKGLPLTDLLSAMGLSVNPGQTLLVKVKSGDMDAAGYAVRTIPYAEINKCFAAYDAVGDDESAVNNETSLRIYCPGETPETVVIANVMGAKVTGEALTGKVAGEPTADSIFFLAVKDDSGQTEYFYFSRAELEEYETTVDFPYNDHSVNKTVTAKGALLSDLLASLEGVNITDDLVIQYAEQDGYHADANTAVDNSSYKDTVYRLSNNDVVNGASKNAAKTVITYEIHEEYQTPDAFNVNDPAGVFKDADTTGLLRAYRETGSGAYDDNIGGANATVIKYLIGVVVSVDGNVLSGKDGLTVSSYSSANPELKVTDDVVYEGLIPGMKYTVRAPDVPNATLAEGESATKIVTAGSGKTTQVSFSYDEGVYFFVKNKTTNQTSNYTYTDFLKIGTQIPSKDSALSYGYQKPMYLRYNGVFLNNLTADQGTVTSAKLITKDGQDEDLDEDELGDYFVCYNNTQSKTSTNIPESKRVTVKYEKAKVIEPATAEPIIGGPISGDDIYTAEGSLPVTTAEEAIGLEITTATTTDAAAHISYIDATDEVAKNYGKGDYVYATLSVTGSGIGETQVFSVRDLELLAADADAGLGYAAEYSFRGSGNSYNSQMMSGIKLYDFLVDVCGMDEALPDSTRVSFVARDGYSVTSSIGDIKALYGSYEEDGALTSEALPVMISYGANGYPLVGSVGYENVQYKPSAAEGYVAAADNGGGPLKITVGQLEAADRNANKNAKMVNKIIIGDNLTYTQHTYAPYDSLKDTALTVKVYEGSGTDKLLETKSYTLAQLQMLGAENNVAKTAAYYGEQQFLEGLDLWWLLSEKVDLPTYEGTAVLGDVTVDLSYLRNYGGDFHDYTSTVNSLTLTGIKPAVIWAKNGYPLVTDAAADGAKTVNNAALCVENYNGPLKIALPQAADVNAVNIDTNLIELHLDATQSEGKHVGEIYGSYGEQTLAISGNGVRQEKTYTVSELENNLAWLVSGQSYQGKSYNGISLQKLLTNKDVKLAADADAVIVKSATSSQTISVLDLASSDILAYSKEGLPLVPETTSTGYEASVGNSDGPLYLISSEGVLEQVIAIEVTTKEGIWQHGDSDLYKEYLSHVLTIEGSGVAATKTYTLAQIEAMTAGTVRDSFASGGNANGVYQGVKLSYLLEQAGVVGTPSQVKVIASDGWSVEVPISDLKNGIDSNYQNGEHRDVILSYAKDGLPLVDSQDALGYDATVENGTGPLRLIVENTISLWNSHVIKIEVSEGTPFLTGFTPLGYGVAQQNVAFGTEEVSLNLPTQLQAQKANGTNVDIDVTWVSEPAYQATTAGEYLFTPIIPQGYEYEAATLPQIVVNVMAEDIPTYVITATAGSGGTISPQGAVTVFGATDQKFVISPQEGYSIKALTVDGTKVDSYSEFTFKNISKAHTIDVTFQKDSQWQNPFKDVKTDAWYYDGISFAVKNDLFKGISSTKFAPAGTMNRAMLVTVLYRVEGEPKVASSSFSDVPKGSYYDKAVAWAASEGIVEGTGGNKFSPLKAATRQEIAKILYNYADYKGLNPVADGNLSFFKDADLVAPWAQEAMKWAVADGVIVGNSKQQLSPGASATRAETATMLQRFIVKHNISLGGGSGFIVDEDLVESSFKVNGEGVTETVITLSDLEKSAKYTDTTYTGRNKEFNNQRQNIVISGVPVADVLQMAGVEGDIAKIKFKSSDGMVKQFTYETLMEDLFSFASGSPVKVPPAISIKENGNYYDASEGQPFRLVMGQDASDSEETKDFNMQNWVRYVEEITVIR